MSKNKLYAHVVLDRSGSMETCRNNTIDAFNEYVKGLAAEKKTSARISLTLFDSGGIDLVHDAVKASDMPKLTRDTFVPRGMTPLNDAIGKTVTSIDAADIKKSEKVALVVMTDGMENFSTEYTKEAIKKLLDGRQKDKGWLVIYLGANQDAWAEGSARGTALGNTMAYDVQNTGAAMSAATRSTVAYAAGASSKDVEFTDKEREKAKA